MSKHQRGKGPPRFVQLFHWMLNSEAWKDLSPVARSIYVELSKRYNGQNNGFIGYSVRDAGKDLNIGKSSAARGFDDLQSHGFIVAEQRGHFHWKINPNGSRIRPASEWRLTIYANNRTANVTEMAPTKECMSWTKIQNAVPPQVRMVPNTGPDGTSHGTMTRQNKPNGTRHGTIKGVVTG